MRARLPATMALLTACVGVAPTDSQWTVAAPAGRLDLLGVCLVDETNGWAVGDIDPRGTGGALYKTRDGGRHWRIVTRTTEVFTTVHFISPQTGWIAGYAGRIERTDDGGKTWKVQRVERGREAISSLFAIDGDRAWTVGARGVALRTTDGGSTWSPMATGRNDDLWSVRFVSPERGWVVGDRGVLLGTTDGGEHWRLLPSGTRKALYGLAVIGPTRAVAVGESGTVLRTENGSDWVVAAAGTSETLSSVARRPSGLFWAVGARGVLLSSRDGGRSWSLVSPVSPTSLTAIDLAGLRRGVAVGRRGAVQVLE